MPERSWFFAINEKDLLDESIRFVRVRGTPIIMFKKNGEIYSLYGKCSHMGCRLSRGTFSSEHVLKCGCHGWEYDISTGKHPGTGMQPLRPTRTKWKAGKYSF